jgi:hypothetical protein
MTSKTRKAFGFAAGVGLVGIALVAGAGELRLTEPSLLFGSSFESGAVIDGHDWNYSGNKPDVTSQQKRGGRYALKSYLHRYHSGTSYRTELRAKAPVPVKGKDTWYGFSIYLPAPYERDSISEILAQWHSTLDPGEKNLNPPMSLQIKEGQWVLAVLWDSKQPTRKQNVRSTGYRLGSHDTNKWTDWVFRVRWSYGSDGELQVWKNGKEVVNRKGPIGYNDRKMPYFKMGIYKSAWRSKVGNVKERTVYHDEVRIAGHGAKYSDVAPGRSN